MANILNLSKTLKEFFNQKANRVSIATGFIKRRRKMKGSSFIKALVFSNMNKPKSSVEEVCQFLAEDSIEITKQGLDFRFTASAVNFMEKMYKESLRLFENKLSMDCQILKQ